MLAASSRGRHGRVCEGFRGCNPRSALVVNSTAETMAELNSDQITLLAWDILHEEMMDGGMIQLIHNGYGAFLWKNPTDKAFRNWGSRTCQSLSRRVHFLYKTNHEEIERDMSDEEFMALYEKFPEFDDFDDEFVENEEEWTSKVAFYIDDHIEQFSPQLSKYELIIHY